MPAERTLGESRAARAALIALATLVVGVVLVLPLATVFVQALAEGWRVAWAAVHAPDALAAIRLTLLVAAVVVPVNTAFGLAAAWCLTRFRFPGRRLLLVLTGLPFSVSPVVAGLVFVLMFGAHGWVARPFGIPVMFAVPGIVLATLFVTLPIVAGQLVPLLDALAADEEEAALTLGAFGWQMFLRVTLPRIRWALLYGVALCGARAMGEFGAVSVVSGRIRGETMTMPLHVQALYDGYDVAAAFAVAALLAAMAVLTLAAKAALEWIERRAVRAGEAAVLSA